MIIGPYYPRIMTQVMVGCACYIISFLLLKDIGLINSIYFYLIIIDTSLLAYRWYRSKRQTKQPEPTATVPSEATEQTISLSDTDDMKITHDTTLGPKTVSVSDLFSVQEKS